MVVATEHYFSTEPRVSERSERSVPLRLADVSVELRTAPGVFSWRRIDPGTRLLLQHAPLPAPVAVGAQPPVTPPGEPRADARHTAAQTEPGATTTTPGAGHLGGGAPDSPITLADVGCGYGPIAVTLALRAPAAHLWAVDVNRRARQLTAANLARAGVRVVDADSVHAATRTDGAGLDGPGGSRPGDAGTAAPETEPRRTEQSEGGGMGSEGTARGRSPGTGTGCNSSGYGTRRLDPRTVRVCGPEDVPEALRVDAFYCNPPVRIGNAALDGLLLEWLGRLRPDGFAVVVMHKHLGADSLLRRFEHRGYSGQRLTTGGGYRVMRLSAGSKP